VKVSQADHRHPRTVYDRQLLLFGVKRDAVLDLWEVERDGLDSFADADYVSVYGMRPADWFARGIRLLGRTTVECTRDALADAIALDVADLARSASSTSGAVVIDPFVGSGNTLYWIVRRLTGCIGRGLELDARVCELTKRNLAIINSPIQIVNTDYLRGLAATTTPPDRLVVVFIAPPWGHALDPMSGLDLRRTTPPITDIIDQLSRLLPDTPLLLAIQVHEQLEPSSLDLVRSRCDWSSQRRYHLNEAGQNHGVLLGTRGWAPPPKTRA
jgi:hypothetical protein